MNKHELGYDRKHSDQHKLSEPEHENLGFFGGLAIWLLVVGCFLVAGVVALEKLNTWGLV